MFAFFGLGAQEVIILGVLALLGIGAVVVVVSVVSRSSGLGQRVNALEQENQRLREDLDRMKDRPT
jgi:hypothetical protein